MVASYACCGVFRSYAGLTLLADGAAFGSAAEACRWAARLIQVALVKGRTHGTAQSTQ